MKLDKQGIPADELREMMLQRASEDRQWKERLAAGVSYPAGDDVLEVAKQAYIDFFSVNALYPGIFLSTEQFEREVIEMTAACCTGTTRSARSRQDAPRATFSASCQPVTAQGLSGQKSPSRR